MSLSRRTSRPVLGGRAPAATILSIAIALGCSEAGGTGPETTVVVTSMSLVAAPSASAQSRQAFSAQPSVQVLDQNGQPLAKGGIAVVAALSAGSGTLNGTTTVVTGANGIARFTDLSIAGTVGPRTLTFSSAGLPPITAELVLTAGAAAVIAAHAGGGQSAAAASAVATRPAVRVTDLDGNAVAGATVTFAVAGGGGSITGGTQVTDASGVATVGGWVLGATLGANTLNATLTGATTASVVFTASAIAGAPSQVVANSATSLTTVVGSPVSTRPSVVVRDAQNNPIVGASVTFAVTGGGGTATGLQPTTDAAGIATVGGWTIGTASGPNTMTATAAGYAGAPVIFMVTGVAGAPTQVTAQTGTTQTAVAGSALNTRPTVVVRDPHGNPVPGVVVTFAITGGGGAGTGLQQTTDAAGIATVGGWTIGTASGANTMIATVAGYSGAPVTFTATGIAGAPTQVMAQTGTTQTAIAGSALNVRPAVVVRDAHGNPVPGVGVTFAITGGGGAGTGLEQTTDTAGIATVGGWTLGTTPATNTMTASAAGVSAPITFSVNAIASGQPTQLGADKTPITRKHLAVFVIDFPDTPEAMRALFPTTAAIRDSLFNGRISSFLRDASFGQFSLTGEVFGYFRHQNPGFVSGAVTEMEAVLEISTINIPGFDVSRYDGVVFLSINDAGLAGGRACGGCRFRVNGVSHVKPIIFAPAQIGYWQRNATQYPRLSNNMVDRQLVGIPTGPNSSIEVESTSEMSRYNSSFIHELVHHLGMGPHANSRTNGTAFEYQPEVPNNRCLCYPAGSTNTGTLLDRDYGNRFDVHGSGGWGYLINSGIRDYCGWTSAANRVSVKDYGGIEVTIQPLNNTSGVRTVEVRIPYQYGAGSSGINKNRGYFLEVRSGNNAWDRMLNHAQLQQNNEGVMVIKTDGYATHLLDMSPSPNLPLFGQVVGDIRDVVLKPGMTYQSNDVRFSNVRKNADGSFTLTVEVLRP